MKYAGMPAGMWRLFARSFRRNLVHVMKYDRKDAVTIMKKSRPVYKELVRRLPEFEKGDRFKMNILSCATLASVLLDLPKKPSVEEVTEYYRESMMTGAMKLFCRMSGKRKFTPKDIRGMEKTAALRAADRNPYSWNMTFHPYSDDSGYEARFTQCGICTLMKELGLFEYVPAMCRLDYTMSEAGGADIFIRKYTLASGGPCCDCGYKKKTVQLPV